MSKKENLPPVTDKVNICLFFLHVSFEPNETMNDVIARGGIPGSLKPTSQLLQDLTQFTYLDINILISNVFIQNANQNF